MLLFSLWTNNALAPTNPLFDKRLITIQENSLVAVSNPFLPNFYAKFGCLTGFSNKVDILSLLEQAAEKYGLNEDVNKFLSVLFCESSLDNSKIGKSGEIGIAQFKIKTWNWFNEIRETDLDIYNELDQIDMFIWAIKNGYQNYWT